MANINDVAKLAGVSVSTVSNVFNNTKYVSENLRQRVIKAAETLQYHPTIARHRPHRTHTIGVITTEIYGLFYPYILKGISEIFEPRGYNMIILDVNSLFDKFSGLERIISNFNHLISQHVDGIIFSSTYPEQVEEAIIGNVKRLLTNVQRTLPLVSVEANYCRYGIDSIFSNSVEAARLATDHLINMGCKNIAHISGPLNTRIAQDRIQGYKEAMQAAGLYNHCAALQARGDYSHRSGYVAMRKLLSLDLEIDGVFVANDQMAVGAMRAIQEYHKRIPEDIKIIGFDDVFVSGMLNPPLSTIHIPKTEIGREAAKMLLSRINMEITSSKPLQMEMKPTLVIRKSTFANASLDWVHEDW